MTATAATKFELITTDGVARRGRLSTAHGEINTPAFMPVGTAGTVKAMMPEDVATTGAEIILGNTYHLMLRPTAERVARLGGLHKFMNWPKPILTDSGGYQVFSLSKRRTINEKGVTFQSHIDGAKVKLTPERSIEIQRLLGTNITMVLDECTEWPISEEDARKSMELSIRWAARCKTAFEQRPGFGLFGIVQGSMYPELRRESVAHLKNIGFEGYAIGGLAIGEPQEEMFEVLEYTVPALPKGRPHYLMGVGKPADIVGAVMRGIDMFDCVIPTRSGRTGQAFVRGGSLNLRNAKHVEDSRPLDVACRCQVCANYNRAYLHHLIKAGEMLAGMLLTFHNLHYYQDLMAQIRGSIESGTMSDFVTTFDREQRTGAVISETE
ncbi:MAG: tRNA guanosine(34) transglycosylase Tgt [Rhodospirillaceae bacterium]|nr:tRNA guanosine(34) transglycosylase Tgt [Rhodospirillaceae bacterium]